MPGAGSAAAYPGLGRGGYRRYTRGAYAPISPFLNPLINPLAYAAFPGYGSIYGYTPRIPLLNFLG